VLELWATERALAAEPWLQENGGPRVQVKLDRELSEAAGTRDHQGVVAQVAPYQYADAYELAQEPSPLLVCLDRVTDPRNLGAVARSAEGAGATGIVVPRTARRWSRLPSAAPRPARSSTCRSRSSRTSRAISAR
jgi:23S rRNA (guanosine2251-2'-O)-methyltransferase